MQCIVVTPEDTVVDTAADFVAVPLFDGEAGILRGHSPMIGRLGFGELRIKHSGGEERYYVDGGFVQVVENVVSVLTNRAIPASSIDSMSAQQQLDDALGKPAAGDEEIAIRDRLASQARGQIRVARRM